MSNQYSIYYKRNTTSELREITNNPEMYHDEARLAAFLELQKRGEALSSEELGLVEKFTNEYQVKAEAKKADQVAQDTEAALPKWYSPMAIMGFAIFFSVLFGSVLLAHNLFKVGKKKEAYLGIGVSIVFVISASFLVQLLGMNQWVMLLTNVLGGMVLIEYFWKRHLGFETKFERKSLLKAILISIAISIIVVLVVMQFYPEYIASLQPGS